MLLRQIGFALGLLVFLNPVFASSCPPADQVQSCRSGQCNFQRVSGWSETVFFTDTGKLFSFLRERTYSTDQGREINCYYSYFDPDTQRMMPPALVLRRIS